MIRARDEVEERVAERVAERLKRPRTSPSFSVEDDCIKIQYSAGIELKLQKDLLTCSLCHENLNPGYSYMECRHNLCKGCSFKVKRTPAGMINCPICTLPSVGQKEFPLLTTILSIAPRTLKCGKVVAGWKGEEIHVANCVKCLKVELQEFRDENESLKKANSRLLKTQTDQSESLGHIREAYKKLQEKYENLRENLPVNRLDDSDDESTSDDI